MAARILEPAARGLNFVAIIALAGLVGVTVFDVTGRYFFSKPLFASVEITEFLLIFLSFGGLACAELRNGNIKVDFFTQMLPERVRTALDGVGALFGMVFWSLISWRAIDHAQEVRDSGEVSLNLGVSTFPFYCFLAVGSALVAIVLVLRIARAINTVRR
ncbi:TRAP transporter small permease [Bradyrhizobium yuanmingense]|uniref:TRAP transporter small permease n=1 Tax=Bradyrhizobium yuanmingense TaxID=108015 RepID=UPI0023B8AB92|nr:TRAP transporter small permease [Bradyrhizobium yuanmingense]MDF0520153.1 TRAP transporter small permease [Bradyrhizobium yuanmingense]